jgi:cation diffusion facilitator CzcD-associated flavoprotein CzcO
MPAGASAEVVIVGAGVAGLCELHHLRARGFSVVLVDRSPDLGGTWYWNRYPGCRFDSESYTYGYRFSPDLLHDWSWQERFAPQPETLGYLNHVASQFDLRPDIVFDFDVTGASWDEASCRWTLTAADGREVTGRYLVTCMGILSSPTLPRLPGIDSFAGQSFHTYYWPHEPVEYAGKRVGVVGTGATGVQLIQTIARDVAELAVFQRRPNWTAPLGNGPISAAEMDGIKARYDEIFAACDRSPGGFVHDPDRRGFWNVPREERVRFWEELYQQPGFAIWLGNFREIFTDAAANAELSEFMAAKIRQRIHDPDLADRMIPADHGFGVQRLPLETGYYEAYNRDNVHLVDLRDTPIEKVTPAGIATTDQHYDLDIIVYATGFDAVTGAFDRVGITGTGGATLRDLWKDGPQTYLGLFVHGFPNLIAVGGPQGGGSGSVNFPRAIEQQTDWAADLLEHMRKTGLRRFEATPEAQAEWFAHVVEMNQLMLLRNARSWFTGYNSNVPGHDNGAPRYLLYNGGAYKYRTTLRQVAESGYAAMELS